MPREFFMPSLVTISTRNLPISIVFDLVYFPDLQVKFLKLALKKRKIEHKKNTFRLFLFLCLSWFFLSYICPRRNVAAVNDRGERL